MIRVADGLYCCRTCGREYLVHRYRKHHREVVFQEMNDDVRKRASSVYGPEAE
jgi:hypothetical protein